MLDGQGQNPKPIQFRFTDKSYTALDTEYPEFLTPWYFQVLILNEDLQIDKIQFLKQILQF